MGTPHDKESPVQCPNCHLLNPPTAEVCDCGYGFGGKSFPAGRVYSRGPVYQPFIWDLLHYLAIMALLGLAVFGVIGFVMMMIGFRFFGPS
jgi:hypothetical protein